MWIQESVYILYSDNIMKRLLMHPGCWSDLITYFTSKKIPIALCEVTIVVGSGFQDPDILTSQSNEILTAIVHGMKKEEPRYVAD